MVYDMTHDIPDLYILEIGQHSLTVASPSVTSLFRNKFRSSQCSYYISYFLQFQHNNNVMQSFVLMYYADFEQIKQKM